MTTPPTHDEKKEQALKLALARMLPDKINLPYSEGHPFYWKDKVDWMVRDTEWLHVSWLVEQTISDTRRGQYNAELSLIASNRNLSAAVKEPSFIFQNQTASWQQRAIALCKVKGVEV